jgi:hypothetical protein
MMVMEISWVNGGGGGGWRRAYYVEETEEGKEAFLQIDFFVGRPCESLILAPDVPGSWLISQ